MARGRSSWGSVQRLDRDRYRLRYWADLGDGYRRRTAIVHGTRREADAKLAQLRTQHERVPGEPVRRASGLTVGQVWEKWHAPDCEARVESGDLAPSTWVNAKATWRRHVEPRWGAVPCREVGALDIQEWLRPMTSVSARFAKMLLGQLLDRAVMYGVVAANPARLRYTMPKTGSGADTGVYTLDGLRDVMAAMHGSPIEAAVILAAFGSCRVGESLGVMCVEVGEAGAGGCLVATAPVVRQVDRDGEPVERLKNPQSRRTVVVPGPLGARLLSIARQRLAEGDPWLSGDGMGNPISQQRAGRLWDTALAGAGVERHPLRNLRNSWETYMHWALCVEPYMIERLMGHAGSTVTARYYDRPDDDALVKAVAAAYLAHPFADTWDFLGHGC